MRAMQRAVFVTLVFAWTATMTGRAAAQVARTPLRAALVIDSTRLLLDVRNLSADSMEGRRTGTPGGEMARRYLDRAFAGAGLEMVGDAYRRPFRLSTGEEGVNFVGRKQGQDTTRVIVVSAHYDHLGRRGDAIYNGADDNASGTAAILAIARAMAGTKPAHSLLFVAMDAEEEGLQGARAFVAHPPLARARIAIDINLDMVSRNDKGELWVSGLRHYPFLRPLIEQLAARAPVTLRTGHDTPGTGSDDWTGASDHGAFHAAGIPFLYFGVEDHPDYHRPTDDFERIQPGFYVHCVRTIAVALVALDEQLDALIPAH